VARGGLPNANYIGRGGKGGDEEATWGTGQGNKVRRDEVNLETSQGKGGGGRIEGNGGRSSVERVGGDRGLGGMGWKGEMLSPGGPPKRGTGGCLESRSLAIQAPQ